jgi:hypothetical protein
MAKSPSDVAVGEFDAGIAAQQKQAAKYAGAILGATQAPMIAVTAQQIEAAKNRLRQRIAQAIREADYHAEPGALAGYLSDLRALDHVSPAEVAQKETTS